MRKRASVLIALALCAGATACGGDDGGSATTDDEPAVTAGPTSGTTDESTAPGSTAPGSTAPDTQAADPEGTFRYATSYMITRFDPPLASNGADGTTLFLAYDRLIDLDLEDAPLPGLATEWSFSNDGLTLNMTLREGVTFQDGEPFNADAVKANLDRAKTVEGSAVAADLGPVESVEVIGEYEVAIHMAQPYAPILAVLADRAGAMVSPAALDNPDLDQNPVGAGMYRVVEFQPDTRIVFERDENYWNPDAVGARRIEITQIADYTTRLNGLKSGEFDAAELLPSQIEDAEGSGITIDARTTLQYMQIYMNKTRAPYDNVAVRQAISYAIDRDGLIEAVDFGQGEANSQIFPEGYWAFNSEIGPDHYTYDPKRAREILAEANLSDVQMDIMIPTSGDLPRIAEVLQAQLADVGITMNIEQISPTNVTDLFFLNKQGDAMLAKWGGRSDPSITITQRWTSTGFTNPGGASLPEVEELHAEAIATIDQDERATLLHEIVAIGTEQALDIPIYNPLNVIGSATTAAAGPKPMLNGKYELRGVIRAAS
jgi:peptide/nickel transport system substrate-binding protein